MVTGGHSSESSFFTFPSSSMYLMIDVGKNEGFLWGSCKESIAVAVQGRYNR